MNPVFAICREDRAFLCRGCDLSIHSANEHVAKHERFLMSGVTVELNAIASTSGAPTPEVATKVQESPSVVPQAAPVVVPQAAPAPAKKTKGTKRKAVQKQDSFNSADAAVPTFMGSLDEVEVPATMDAEFNSFVQDFLGSNGKEAKGDVNMSNFLDNIFDDIPEDDFGVVPDMGFVQ